MIWGRVMAVISHQSLAIHKACEVPEPSQPIPSKRKIDNSSVRRLRLGGAVKNLTSCNSGIPGLATLQPESKLP